MSLPTKMYGDLADWWHLLSQVEDYEEEAEVFARVIQQYATSPVGSVLELGAGGGNNAFHLKSYFTMTLVDLSEAMLEQSRRINPECVHHQGDMRTVRLGQTFDAVFIHDAIDYMTTLDDLRRALETAFVHCKPGGVALFVPDHLKETFVPDTDHGGHDGPDRSLRYLKWTWDPDPDDALYTTDYAYLLRLPDGTTQVHTDRHVHGLFRRQDWLDAISGAGFTARTIPFEHSELEPGRHELFIGGKPMA